MIDCIQCDSCYHIMDQQHNCHPVPSLSLLIPFYPPLLFRHLSSPFPWVLHPRIPIYRLIDIKRITAGVDGTKVMCEASHKGQAMQMESICHVQQMINKHMHQWEKIKSHTRGIFLCNRT